MEKIQTLNNMQICGIEKLSLVDFDNNITCTLFTGGCNFACPFCHNSSLVINNSRDVLNNDEIMKYLRKRQGIIEAVCISGGEPTLQKDLKQFIMEIKKLGYMVKLDTNGTNYEVVKELIDDGLIDYVAMDIKNSFAKYSTTAGVKNINYENIKKSIDLLLHGKCDYEFRTTLVYEFHDLGDIEQISLMLKGAKQYFLQKFVNNENCINNNLHCVEQDVAEKYLLVLQKNIQNVSLRGY